MIFASGSNSGVGISDARPITDECRRAPVLRLRTNRDQRASALASAGGTDLNLAGPQFDQNCVPTIL